MPVKVNQKQTAQVMVASEPWLKFEPTADVSAANAKLAFTLIPKTAGGGNWPLWQVSYYFSAGTAKTATMIIHARDEDTAEWHALASMDMIHSDAVTTSNGQVLQFEAPPRHDAIGLEIDLTNADERPHVVVRGAAFVDVPVEALP